MSVRLLLRAVLSQDPGRSCERVARWADARRDLGSTASNPNRPTAVIVPHANIDSGPTAAAVCARAHPWVSFIPSRPSHRGAFVIFRGGVGVPALALVTPVDEAAGALRRSRGFVAVDHDAHRGEYESKSSAVPYLRSDAHRRVIVWTRGAGAAARRRGRRGGRAGLPLASSDLNHYEPAASGTGMRGGLSARARLRNCSRGARASVSHVRRGPTVATLWPRGSAQEAEVVDYRHWDGSR
jgi:hypothetical protein